MMTSADIREKFLSFFRSKDHAIVASAPIVVKDDPTLMFTNAGMNQFKDYFLGNKLPPRARVADTQKCLRVSGKHNDLEEVGVDTYHHTMFEMLGNWSFGDYFKKEAIAWSWELLTEVYGIPKDRLYVTIFEGDEKEKLPKDFEALQEWEKWLAPDRVLPGTKKDNFWEMGDTGPCGPCTEIHVDCRSAEERKMKDGKELVNNDHPQVIEIWNNVFIQFNRLKDGTLEPLPARHVDTGMGLERLVRVLQEKNSNYDTDIFTGTIREIEKITGREYTAGGSRKDIAFRVLADHIRAISFTIADGQLPSNTGAGYVIRRILRRAVRYYYSYLDYKQTLLYQLVPVLAGQFTNVFPELEKQKEFVAKVIREEEEAFLRTLDKGLKKIDELISSSGTTHISGKHAFELYDTYGFPIDLTRLIAVENNVNVDENGFTAEMTRQKQRSRAATSIETGDWTVLDDFALNSFVGYDTMEARTKIAKYRKVKAKGKDSYQLILEVTPFYAESGGQVGDTGVLEFDGESIKVTDTRKENELIIHFTDTLPAKPDAPVVARVDQARRKAIMAHHTATHLLHAALRTILGTHVAQKGSLVADEHFRFDFSHFTKMSEDEIRRVESMVNEKIRQNIPVEIRFMAKDEAIALGAMALFGEKYSDTVRVVIVDPSYSIELCGGTHVMSTGELGFFTITQETAIAAGVRRIEAVCGEYAEQYLYQQLSILSDLRSKLKQAPDLGKAIENLLQENAETRKKIEKLELEQLNSLKTELLKRTETVNGLNFLGQVIELGNADAIKKLSSDLRQSFDRYLIVLAANIDGKAQVAVSVDEQTVSEKGIDAVRLIREKIAPLIKGGGGGQKTMASAGGQDVTNLQKAVDAVRSSL